MSRPVTLATDHLVDTLSALVRGQDDAIAGISAAIASGRRRILLIGPPSTGKTMAAVAAAEALGGCVRLDGAAFKDGASSQARLADAIADRDHRVIVLDEIEKAHPEAIAGLVARLDADRTTACIATTNWRHADAVRIADVVGCGAHRDASLCRMMSERFDPTLLDAVVVFRPFAPDVFRGLVVDHVRASAAERLITVASISPAAIGRLVAMPCGIREVQRAVQRSLDPATAGDVVRLVMRRGAVGMAVVGRMPVRRSP